MLRIGALSIGSPPQAAPSSSAAPPLLLLRYVGFWWTYLGVANVRFEPAGFLPNYLVASTLQVGFLLTIEPLTLHI